MKADQQLSWTIVIFFAGFFLGTVVEEKTAAVMVKDYLPAVSTLLAAFIGARFAFQLQHAREIESEEKKSLAAGNRALFALMRQLNKLGDVQHQVINPWRDKPGRFLRIQPVLPIDVSDFRIDVDSLAFLLEGEDVNVLSEVALEQSRFETSVQAVNDRSRMHLEEAQPLLDRAGVVEGKDYLEGEIKAALGERVFAVLSRSTDQMIVHVDQTVQSHIETGNKLSIAMRKRFPGRQVLAMQLHGEESEQPGTD